MLALIVAGVGLIQIGTPEPREVTLIHGVTYGLDGTGIYRHESIQGAATFRGADAILRLVLCVPLLLKDFSALAAWKHPGLGVVGRTAELFPV